MKQGIVSPLRGVCFPLRVSEGDIHHAEIRTRRLRKTLNYIEDECRSLPSETDILNFFHDDTDQKIEQVVAVTQNETQLPGTRVSCDLLLDALSKTTYEGCNSCKNAFRRVEISLPSLCERSAIVIKPLRRHTLKRSTPLPSNDKLTRDLDQLMFSIFRAQFL